MTTVTTGVTNAVRRWIRDIHVGRFRITLERAGLGQPGGTPGEAESSVGKGLPAATYSNGRGERRQADTDDLNVPLLLGCEVVGQARWLAVAE